MTDKKAALEAERKRKLDDLEQRIGYQFQRRELLALALTHSSLRDPWTESNERLEFLGDSVVGLAIAQHLFTTFPALAEGELTRLKSLCVSAEALLEVGKTLDVSSCLRVGKGIRKGRAVPKSLIANAVEAVVGAIYLDSGFEAARDRVIAWLDERVRAKAEERKATNFKAALQQATQRIYGIHPTYHVVETHGPDHKKEFVVEARADQVTFPAAKGKTKKLAEQKAARLALRQLKRESPTNEDDRPAADDSTAAETD